MCFEGCQPNIIVVCCYLGPRGDTTMVTAAPTLLAVSCVIMRRRKSLS